VWLRVPRQIVKRHGKCFSMWQETMRQCQCTELSERRMERQVMAEVAGHDVAGGALCPSLPPGTFTSLVSGTQSVSKGRQGPQAVNNVQVIS